MFIVDCRVSLYPIREYKVESSWLTVGGAYGARPGEMTGVWQSSLKS